MSDLLSSENLRPCCSCGKDVPCPNLVNMDRKAPVPGTGWGCLQCGLPADGAMAVVCERCFLRHKKPIAVVFGYITSRERRAIEELEPGVFEHDLTKHPEEDKDDQGQIPDRQIECQIRHFPPLPLNEGPPS